VKKWGENFKAGSEDEKTRRKVTTSDRAARDKSAAIVPRAAGEGYVNRRGASDELVPIALVVDYRHSTCHAH
jgi:hypothetical protein